MSSTSERFLAKFIPEPNSGCWLWHGAYVTMGYGWFQNEMAHRASYMMHVGPIPKSLYVLHKCDVKECVNPEHLFVGTQKENLVDASRKGRLKRKKQTHCNRGHPFDDQNTYYQSTGRRGCRECHRVAVRNGARKFRAKRKGREDGRYI